MTEEQLVQTGVDAENLLGSDAFNTTINQLVEASFQTFTNTNPGDVKEREHAYHHYRALVEIVQTLQQKVQVKDEIQSKTLDDNNQEEKDHG